MSETPSDEAWAKIQEQRLSGRFSARPLTPALAFDLGFNAGRASVTPPTREVITEALKIGMLGTTDGDFIDPNSEIPAGEMYRLALEAVLALFAVPPTESEGK